MDCALAGAETHRGRPLNRIVSCHMGRFHIGVSVALVGLATATYVAYRFGHWSIGALIYVSYFATLFAVAVAIVVLVLLMLRAFRGTAAPLWKRSWLAVANGGAAALWAAIM